MFETYTEGAIKVIMLAQEESRRLGHNYVGTEMLLLGLIGEGTGIAAQALKSVGLTLGAVRIEVERIIGRGAGHVATEIPFTPSAKKVLELALAESHQLGHSRLDTEHLLLGLIQEHERAVGEIFAHFGVESISVREKVVQLWDEKTPESSSPPKPAMQLDDTIEKIKRMLERSSKGRRGESSLEGDKNTLELLRSIDTKILKIERDFNNLKWDLIALRDRFERENNGQGERSN
jgi:ATP-dependent Clp protease ATP-binding subunit ClpC